jgi:predicted SnoaL-like aldol condensation-catalyzing enzyme
MRPAFTPFVVVGLPLLAAALAAPVVAGDGAKAVEERNKQVAIEFYNAALNEKNWDKARSFIGNRYVQHNPGAVDGPEGLRQHIEFLKREWPRNHGEIKQVLADGDLVALHVHSRRSPELRGNAIVDIFRIENGKVVEHWDVVQPIPDPGKALNGNSMF